MQGLCYLRVIMLQLCLRKWQGKAHKRGKASYLWDNCSTKGRGAYLLTLLIMGMALVQRLNRSKPLRNYLLLVGKIESDLRSECDDED